MTSQLRFPAYLLLALAALPAAARAQDGYTFDKPTVTFSFRAGLASPSASDDLFSFFTRELTLERGDFRTVGVAGDATFFVEPRFAITVGIGHDRSENRSEFRDWVDQDDRPIEQTTQLNRVPITLSARYYLGATGRSLGRHVWVPASITPYVTAGGGWMVYKLVQRGEFVDFNTLDVFTREFRSSGGGMTFHGGAGAEWWLVPQVSLNAEARYAWAKATLDRDFADFGDINLRGLQLNAGLGIRF